MARVLDRGRLSLLVAVVGIACGDDAASPLRLELPLAPSHRSALLGVRADDGRDILIASDIAEGAIDPVMQPLLPDGRVQVAALLYEAPLAELSLSPGPVLAVGSTAAGRPLPTPAEIHEVTVEPPYEPVWVPADTLPEHLAGLRIPEPNPCATFTPRAVSLGEVFAPTSVVGLDETWALVTTAGPEVFFTDGTQVVRQPVSTPLSAGYVRADGEVWLGGEGGAIFSARFTADPQPQLELTPQGTVSSRERVVDLVGAPDGALEHFAMTVDDGDDETWGTFEWFDGVAWRVPGLRRNTPHDATWVSPGYGLFASFFRDGEVYGARDGEEISIVVPNVVFGNVVVIEQVPGFGLAAGTTAGTVHFERGDGAWRVTGGDTTQRILDVRGYHGGLVYARGTSVVHLPEDATACDEAGLLTRTHEALPRMDVVGAHVIVPLTVLDGQGSREQQVAWFERTR